jgi:glutathione S-transferase
MLRLYDAPLSGNCYKVRLLLSHLERPYERVDVNLLSAESRRESLEGRTPIGKVPVLELDDGRCLAESNAILWYLARGTPFLPTDPFAQAQTLQWMFFEQNNLEPNLAVARQWVVILKEAERHREALKAKYEAGGTALSVLDRHLERRRFLLGQQPSVADVSIYAYTHVAEEGGFDLEPYAAVRAWLTRMAKRPGHVPMEDAEAPGPVRQER